MSAEIVITVDPIEIGLPEGEPIVITVNDEPSINLQISEIGRDGKDGKDGTDGEGVPRGGTVGQALVKIDGTDFNTQWADQSGGGVSSEYVAAMATSLSMGGF